MSAEWNFAPPAGAAEARDKAVALKPAGRLAGKRVALLIGGSIAAYRTPDLARALRREGASVRAFCSASALDFVTPMALEWTSGEKPVTSLSADAEHVEGDLPYDYFLVAPATYNTINSFACGLASGVLGTVLASALGRLEAKRCRIAVLPCMHGTMHNAILIDSLKRLKSLGVDILKPRQEDGKDKLPEIDEIVAALAAL